MVDVPTREDFEARFSVAEAAIVDLRRRVGILESATPGGGGGTGGGSTLPALSSVRAASVTTTGATLTGVVEPRGLPFTWQFEYGPSTSYGSVSPTAATPSVAPVADIGPTTSILRQGSITGPQMRLSGMNVWGISDSITGSFGTEQYNARAAIAATLKSWGVNWVRLRLLANDYNGMSAANQAAYVQKAVDWRDTLRAQGILTCFCWWDALDGTYAGASWATNYNRSFAMMSAVIAAVGPDPYVFFEPFNEPNNITDAQWDTAMRATIAHFRSTAGYKGLLIVDPNTWAHAYDDTRFSGIESYDSTLTGTGKANVAFARHDYPNDYSGNTFNGSTWLAATGGSDESHIIIESEYGVYNGPGTNVPAWGNPSSTYFAGQMQTRPNFAGAAPFLFGPWLDANAITTSDNSTTTTWGGYAKANFLANANGSAVPAYTTPAPGAGSGVGVGTGQQTVSTTLTSLAGNALYHARLKATSSAGTAYSPDFTFSTASTPATPVITYDHSFEDSAVGTGNNQAQYTGASWTTVTSGSPATADFSYRYATTAGDKVTLRFHGSRLVIYAPDGPGGAPSAAVTVDGAAAGSANFYTTSTPANGVRFDTGNLGSADADHTVVITVPATANKTIFFDHAEVYILTAGGTTVTAPTVTTSVAVGITGNSAVLSGIVTPNNGATAWRFDFGTTTSYGATWPNPDGSVPATAGPTPVSVTVTGLTVNTLYHYRLRATNSAGTTSTVDGTFTTAATATTTGRITRSGVNLQLNGSRYKFAGMNWPSAVGCGLAGAQPDATTAVQYFTELNPHSMTRIWVVPGMDLAKYDTIFNAAKATGQYLCVTLFNSAAFCTSFVPGYTTPLDSTTASWIQQVCSRHANEPTVAMYECANDAPETNGNIANWYQAVGALIKQYDPQALVGTGGGIALNNAAAIAAVASGAAVDMISYHEDYAPAGSVGPRAAIYNTASTTAGKPWYMGSRSFAGTGGDTGSLATNGQRLSTEYGLYLAGSLGNCAGYMYQNFDLVNSTTATADLGNGLWDAARTYNNSAYNGTTPGTGGGGTPTPGTGWWIFGGSYNHNVESASDDWQRVMAGGRPVTEVLAYQTRGNGWGDMLNTGGYPFDKFTNKSRQMILQMSPFPTNVGATYAALISGAYDTYWRNFGAGLKAREDSGHRPVICSISWEMNGTYFPWGGTDAGHSGGGHFTSSAQYIAGYQRIVNALRSTYPNVETAWVINGHSSNPQANSWELYPGDSYVTYPGGDWYNWYDGNPQSEAAFNTEANDPDGIRWMLAKVRAAGPDARGRSKKLIVPEWGIANGYGTPGDHADWVRWMFKVFQDAHATGHMGPENYFNEASGSPFDIYFTKPNSRAAYKALYAP